MRFKQSVLSLATGAVAMTFAVVTTLSAITPAAAQIDKGLLDCRVLPDPTSRLFCYDRFVDGALANPPRVAPPPAPAAPVAPTVPLTNLLYTRPPLPSVAPPTPSAPAAPSTPTQPMAPAKPVTPPAAAAPPAQKFGEENLPAEKREQPVESAPETLRARVTKVSADPYGATIIVLDNGQTWKQAEGSKYRVSVGTGVTISRGMLGAFFLKADNSSLSIKFKRIE